MLGTFGVYHSVGGNPVNINGLFIYCAVRWCAVLYVGVIPTSNVISVGGIALGASLCAPAPSSFLPLLFDVMVLRNPSRLQRWLLFPSLAWKESVSTLLFIVSKAKIIQEYTTRYFIYFGIF
jgi:hypothetical protein